MKKGKLILIVALVVAMGVTVYFSFIRKTLYDKLVALFKEQADPSALVWLMPIKDEYLNGTRHLDSAYLVDGKITDGGAFLAAYASSYYKPDGSHDALHNQMYGLLIDEQTKHL